MAVKIQTTQYVIFHMPFQRNGFPVEIKEKPTNQQNSQKKTKKLSICKSLELNEKRNKYNMCFILLGTQQLLQ